MADTLRLRAPWGVIWDLKKSRDTVLRPSRILPKILKTIDDILSRAELWFYEESVGQAGTEMECDPPCYSISGYTDSFFNLSGCACDTVTSQADHWDGVWHQYRHENPGELLPGQKRYERKCIWTPWVNDGDFPSPDRISNKVLSSSILEPTDGDERWLMVVKCNNLPGSTVIWQGTSENKDPTSLYTRDDSASCDNSSSTKTIKLDKASAHGCWCPSPQTCPSSSADCEDWPSTLYGTLAGYTGFGCEDLNGCYSFPKSGACDYPGVGFPAPGYISCSELGAVLPSVNPGYWVFKNFQSGFSVLGVTGDSEPPLGTYRIRVPCGACNNDNITFTLSDEPC